MSIEVRYKVDGECNCRGPYGPGERPARSCEHYWECDYGRIPSFDINNLAPLVITGRDFANWLFKEGPREIRGGLYSLTVVPIPEPDGEITGNSEVRMFQHIDYEGRRWTWEFEPAHWANPAEIRTCIDPIYLGRWPD